MMLVSDFATSIKSEEEPKFAEHGGRGAADQDIFMLLEGPSVQAGYTTNKHVWIMQIGSTVAADMCLNLANATYPVLPGTTGDHSKC